MTGSIISLFSDDPLTFSLLFKRSEACWEQTGTEEGKTGVLQWWEMSVSHPVTVNLFTSAWTTLDRFGKCLKWLLFVQSGIVFGRSCCWDEAQDSTAHSIGEGEGGCITPICQDDSVCSAGGQSNNSASEFGVQVVRDKQAAHPESGGLLFQTTLHPLLAVFIFLPESDVCRDLRAQYITRSRYKI